MTDNNNTTPSELTSVNRDAQNPNGQRHTMAGTTGSFVPKGSEMSSTVRTTIDPTSHIGCTDHMPSK